MCTHGVLALAHEQCSARTAAPALGRVLTPGCWVGKAWDLLLGGLWGGCGGMASFILVRTR